MSVPIDIRDWEPLITEKLIQALHVNILPSKYSPNPPPVGIFRQCYGILMVPLTYARQQRDFLLKYAQLDNLSLPTNSSICPLKFHGELRPQQIPPVQEAWQALRRQGTVFLAMQPGFGKTSISLYLASYLSGAGHTIVLCAKSLLGQWRESINKFLQVDAHVVSDKPIPADTKILICTPAQAKKIPFRWRNCGVLIIDECHTFATTSRLESILSCYPRYIIANSATIIDSPNAFIKLSPICGNIVVRNIERHSFRIFIVKTGVNLAISMSDNKADWHDLITRLCRHKERNALLVEKVRQVLPGNKVLILTWRNQGHAQKLAKIFSKQGIEPAVYTDSVDRCEDRPLTIATISKGGTGFDAKTAIGPQSEPFNVLFLVTSMKSSSLIKQSIGRIYRASSPRVYYFLDEDFISLNHFRQVKRIIQEENGYIIW